MQKALSTLLLTFLDRYRDAGLLILRIGLGIAFLFHGVPKLMGGPPMWAGLGANMQNFGITFGYTFWGFMSAFSEAGGGLLLILGLLFRYASLMMFINMAVALGHHLGAGDGFNVFSHALEDGVVFLSLILIGPGRFAIDSAITKRKTVAAMEPPVGRP